MYCKVLVMYSSVLQYSYVLVVVMYCTVDVLVMYRQCAGDVLVMYCTRDVLVMYW
jgi:hypothetical protein